MANYKHYVSSIVNLHGDKYR